MISHTKKFIFVHINKTGGTSVERKLKEFQHRLPYRDKHQFLTAHIKGPRNSPSLLSECREKPENYFKFTFVRNPWDKLVSNYFWRGSHLLQNKAWAKTSFKEWVMRKKGFNFKKCMARWNQVEWLCDKEGAIHVDFIGRFERLQKDFNVICTKLNIGPFKLPHVYKTRHKHYSTYYDDETKDFVSHYFKKDIETLNYKFESK